MTCTYKRIFSLLLDLCSEDLVSYTISDRPVLGMITSMLEKAFETIPYSTNLIFHSDQGWQCLHKQYRRILEEKGLRQSKHEQKMQLSGQHRDRELLHLAQKRVAFSARF